MYLGPLGNWRFMGCEYPDAFYYSHPAAATSPPTFILLSVPTIFTIVVALCEHRKSRKPCALLGCQSLAVQGLVGGVSIFSISPCCMQKAHCPQAS